MAVTGLIMVVMTLTVTLATTGAVAIRRERVKVMEVQLEEMEKAVERHPWREEIAAMVKLNPSDPPSLPDLVKNLGLSDLYDSIKLAGLVTALSAPGHFTLFAPTNQAFEDEPAWVEYLKAHKAELAKVLMYHVLPNQVTVGNIRDEETTGTLLEGKPIRFNIYPNKVKTAQCAPIDVEESNQTASNGILHELKAVMVPPTGNIPEAVAKMGDFTLLVMALTRASLLEDLGGDGPFTVFAPTDAAFKKLDPVVLENLLKNVTALREVLKYHVVKLTYCLPGLVYYRKLQMWNGKNANITVSGDSVKINDALVMPAGIHGSVTNGVLHVIDTVLLPPSFPLQL